MNRYLCCLVLGLAACATETTKPDAPPPAADPSVIAKAREEALASNLVETEQTYCGDAAHPPADRSGELTCGDFLAQLKHDTPGALSHWRHAYQLASARDEQCEAVHRIVELSLTPEKDWGDVSPTVVAECRALQTERRSTAQMAQISAGQHQECVTLCGARWARCSTHLDALACWELSQCESSCP